MSEITFYADKSEWLASRRETLNASEIGGILGLSEYASPYSIWCEKRFGKDTGSTLPQRVGVALEETVADEFEGATGIEVYNPNIQTIAASYIDHEEIRGFAVCPHPLYPWLRATPDRLTLDNDPVECKTMDRARHSRMAEEYPRVYWVQLQIQMQCLGAWKGYLALLIGNSDFRYWEIERDDEWFETILPELKEFHACIISGDPPAIDGKEATKKAIAKRFSDPVEDEVVMLTDNLMSDITIRIEELKEDINAKEMELDLWQNRIKEAIGDAVIGRLEDGSGWSWKPQTRAGELKVKGWKPEQIEDIKAAITLMVPGVKVEVGKSSTFRVLRRLK